MALKANINGKVRNVSPAMARVLRAKGIAVEGDKARVVAPAPKPQPQPVKKLDEVLPPVIKAAEPKAISFDTLTDSFEAKTPEPIEPTWKQPSIADLDLSDEELERLTNPES